MQYYLSIVAAVVVVVVVVEVIVVVVEIFKVISPMLSFHSKQSEMTRLFARKIRPLSKKKKSH